MGWKTIGTRFDMSQGSAWEEGVSYLLKNGLTRGNVDRAMEIYKNTLISIHPDPPHPANAKSDDNVFRALNSYIEKYQNDEFRATESQKLIEIPVSPEGDTMYGLPDEFGNWRNQKAIIDHKASGREDSQLRIKWEMRIQSLLYTLWLKSRYEQSAGVIIRTTFFRKSNKWDGSEHISIYINPDSETLSDFIIETKNQIKNLKQSLESLSTQDPLEKSSLQITFPKNRTSCFNQFGACEFIMICKNNPKNPLRLFGSNTPPGGFKIEHWSPCNRALEKVQLREAHKGKS
jgi:hypothetical protein